MACEHDLAPGALRRAPDLGCRVFERLRVGDGRGGEHA
jgi:hypothetical protein